jgi:hypothetical protein
VPTQPPTPRYRVIERGRRLEVIDTLTGEAVKAAFTPEPGRAAASRWPTLPETEGFDGRALLSTHPWYDNKAPRRVLLDPGTMQWIGVAKGVTIVAAIALVLVSVAAPLALAVLLLPLALPSSLRDTLRRTATGWLDTFDDAPGR